MRAEGDVGRIELAGPISGPQVDGWRAPRQPPFIVKYAPRPLFMITNVRSIGNTVSVGSSRKNLSPGFCLPFFLFFFPLRHEKLVDAVFSYRGCSGCSFFFFFFFFHLHGGRMEIVCARIKIRFARLTSCQG